MPELPEVERVRRGLADSLMGRSIASVHLGRADVVRGRRDAASLLSGSRIEQIDRRGKQLALIGRRPGGRSRVLCVHLGMTGSLVCEGPAGGAANGGHKPHTHVVWHLAGGGSLRFRDVRRFGGIWPFADWAALEADRWARLGEDALTIRPCTLYAALRRTRRAIKTALLDQQILAGLGNIYVDELLFAAGLHPARSANTLTLPGVQRLVRQMRRLLHRAIDAGGSTFRDYVDPTGRPGGFQQRHRVYGRASLPCRRCRTPLAPTLVAGRTTVFCPACQPR